MPIRLPFVINSTPDSVQSKLSCNDEKVNQYVWKFRNKTQKGIHLYVTPIKLVETEGVEWEVELYTVEWNGNDYHVDKKPLNSYIHDNFEDAISCAEKATKNLADNNADYNHIL